MARALRGAGHNVIAASHSPGADIVCDLEAPDGLFDAIDSLGVQSAVICSGISNIDRCAREPAETARFNVQQICRLINGLQERGIGIVFCSSDMVFAGDVGGYRENDAAIPTSEYGRQKKAVESFLASSGKPHAILRMSKLYSMEPSDNSIIHQILKQVRSGGELRAADDLIMVPTAVEDVARTVLAIVSHGLGGVFHITPRERYSRYELARRICETARAHARVVRCSIDDFALLERRPKSLWLDGAQTAAATDVRPIELASVLDEMIARASAEAPKV